MAALAFETTSIGERKTIILHPGDYSENVTLDTQYIVLTTHESIGKNTSLSGTLTISKGCTVNGLKMTNLAISATSANGSVDIINCTVTTATTKTSSAYTNFRGCDLSSSTLSITGAGSVVLVGGNYGSLTVNNASAGVLAKAVITMGPVTLTAGTLQLSDTLIYSATNTSNAITQSAGSFLTVNNSQTLIPDLSNVARNSFGGYYSILHSVYDKANSTFGGTSLNAIEYSQYINADRLTLNGSTSGNTILNATATAGSTTLTLPAATDTLVGRATTDTLTNKSISLTTNTITGTLAEFNTALSGDDFVSLTGSETLTNKTLTSPVISSITNTGTLTLPTSTDTLVGRATTDTLTNKSVSVTTNTVTGTLAEFNTALSDDNFVSLTGSETLTNKTLTSPRIGTSVLDTNGNELLLLTATASAVNELTLANAAAANRPTISATGSDANIGISIKPKGTGTILVESSNNTFYEFASTELTIPGNLQLTGNIRSEGAINIDINLSDSTLRRWRFGEDGNLETPGGVQVAGILKINDGVHEQFQAKVDATGIVTHDCSLGHIFYHTSPDALFTVNFTNLNLSSGYATALTLIIVQGGTGFIPNSVGIGGVIQTLNWQGNVTPTPSTNRTDVVTFSIINNAGTYTVLGQLIGF